MSTTKPAATREKSPILRLLDSEIATNSSTRREREWAEELLGTREARERALKVDEAREELSGRNQDGTKKEPGRPPRQAAPYPAQPRPSTEHPEASTGEDASLVFAGAKLLAGMGLGGGEKMKRYSFVPRKF